MRYTLSWIFLTLGKIAFAVFGMYGLILELLILDEASGFEGVMFGLGLFPLLLTLGPWITLYEEGNWIPVLVIYGGGTFALAVCYIGIVLGRNRHSA